MNWVVVGAGPIGVALAFEGHRQGMPTPHFVEHSPEVATQAKARLVNKGIKAQFNLNLNDLNLKALNADVFFFAAPWTAIRQTFFRLTEQLSAANQSPAIICLGSARLDTNDRDAIEQSHCRVLLGAGLEPGFIEAMITSTAAEFPSCLSITTYCGGIPCFPQAPLNFYRQFGARPHFAQRKTYRRDCGTVIVGNRFEETGQLYFPGVGLLEAFDDAMLPYTADDSRIGVPSVAQKTLRWPGYADTLKTLHKLGLLRDIEVSVGGQKINIAKAVEATICPEVKSSSDVQVLAGIRAKTNDTVVKNLFLSCTGKVQDDVSPMAYMTAIPAIAAFECLQTERRHGLYFPSDPVLRDVAPKSLERFRKSHSVNVISGDLPELDFNTIT